MFNWKVNDMQNGFIKDRSCIFNKSNRDIVCSSTFSRIWFVQFLINKIFIATVLKKFLKQFATFLGSKEVSPSITNTTLLHSIFFYYHIQFVLLIP